MDDIEEMPQDTENESQDFKVEIKNVVDTQDRKSFNSLIIKQNYQTTEIRPDSPMESQDTDNENQDTDNDTKNTDYKTQDASQDEIVDSQDEIEHFVKHADIKGADDAQPEEQRNDTESNDDDETSNDDDETFNDDSQDETVDSQNEMEHNVKHANIKGADNPQSEEEKHDTKSDDDDETCNDVEMNGEDKKKNAKNTTKDAYYDYGEDTLSCDKCHKKFDSKTGLLNHMRMHIITKPPLQCAICKQQFITNKQLIHHKEQHAEESHSFLCNKCKLAFSDHCDFLLHNLIHTNKSLYKCEECHMYFKIKSCFKSHIPTHYNKKILCKICNKEFPSEKLFTTHQRLHSEIYKCGECGKVCCDSKNLKYHMISHTGVKPYQCHYCGKGCSSIHQRISTYTSSHESAAV